MMNNRFINIAAFSVLTLLWLAFALALIFNNQLLDSTWAAFRSWPLLVQLLAGLLFLPVAAGLWVWETSWPVLLRLVLVAGLAWATFFTFNPWKARNRPELSKEAA
jgi:hypothetical protein